MICGNGPVLLKWTATQEQSEFSTNEANSCVDCTSYDEFPVLQSVSNDWIRVDSRYMKAMVHIDHVRIKGSSRGNVVTNVIRE